MKEIVIFVNTGSGRSPEGPFILEETCHPVECIRRRTVFSHFDIVSEIGSQVAEPGKCSYQCYLLSALPENNYLTTLHWNR